MEEIDNEWEVFKGRLLAPWRKLTRKLPSAKVESSKVKELTALSTWSDDGRRSRWNYISPRYKADRAITCPNSAAYGCLDLWGPDLFAEFAGVCSHCGYHFPMEPEWYVKNVFDLGSVFEFNSEIEAGNPLDFPNFGDRVLDAQKKTGAKSGCMTFEARIDGTSVMVAMFMGAFRGGSVGAAEGEKIRAEEQRVNDGYAKARGMEDALVGGEIPGPIVPAVLDAARRSLRHGGVVLPGTFDRPPDRLARMLVELRTLRSGGHPWSPTELCDLLSERGFESARHLPRTWPVPVELYLAEVAAAASR